jgi:hypothetical protein
MKVAVFICGQPKFFDPCLQSQLDFFRASGFVFDRNSRAEEMWPVVKEQFSI